MTKERKTRTAWHPAFASAMKLEFRENENDLSYEVEHVLNQQPLKVDFIVIRKNPQAKLVNEIGEIFRGHNLVEFKSEEDALNINTIYKAMGYACLYKAYGKPPQTVGRDDVTVTLLRRNRPQKLLRELQAHGDDIQQTHAGIYTIRGMQFPLQIIVTKELSNEKLHWVRTVARGLELQEIRQAVMAIRKLEKDYEKQYADDVLAVLTRENNEAVQKIKEEGLMCKELLELMRPEIDAEIAAEKKAAKEVGLQLGIQQGMQQGMQVGKKEGFLAALIALVKDDLLNLKEAARRAGMSEKDFRAAMAAS